MDKLKKVTLVGDSIRMGYQKFVHDELRGLAEVSGSDENGEHSEKILHHLNEWIISERPHIVHINCGLHDLKRKYGANGTTIPIIQYKENLCKIFEGIKRDTNSIIIWATITPVNEKWHREFKGFDRLEADVESYNEVAVTVAKKYGVLINDLFSIINQAGRDLYLSLDGVHFNDKGYILLGKVVSEYIKPILSSISKNVTIS